MPAAGRAQPGGGLIPPPGAIVVAIELADKRRAEANGQLGAAWLATLAESRVSTKPIGAARVPGDANRDRAAERYPWPGRAGDGWPASCTAPSSSAAAVGRDKAPAAARADVL